MKHLHTHDKTSHSFIFRKDSWVRAELLEALTCVPGGSRGGQAACKPVCRACSALNIYLYQPPPVPQGSWYFKINFWFLHQLSSTSWGRSLYESRQDYWPTPVGPSLLQKKLCPTIRGSWETHARASPTPMRVHLCGSFFTCPEELGPARNKS